MRDVTVIVLAGGTGSRCGGTVPKQFAPFQGKMLCCHSIELFLSLPDILEIIVVADDTYHNAFKNYPGLIFAKPGERRQDSLYHALQKVSSKANFVCIHDAARPLITKNLVTNLFEEGRKFLASTLAIPVSATIKEANFKKMVVKTLPRDVLWEIQTPQFISKKILIEGFKIVKENNITVTDDVSIVELTSHPVKLVEGSLRNIKITKAEDFAIASALYKL